MRAAFYDSHGGGDRIRLLERPTPTLKPGHMLVRVMAAAVNSWDWDKLSGNVFGRLNGPFGPRDHCLGAEIAGVVEAVAPDVTAFRPGDRVLGDLTETGWGGFAELALADPRGFIAMPEGLDFIAAATIPQAGLLAWQGLNRGGALARAKSVLVNGAGGGMGAYAVLLAKRAGARVTAVDRSDKAEFMRQLGADTVIDYRTTEFATLSERHDLVLDAQARRPVRAQLGVLNPRGRYVVVGGTVRALLASVLLGKRLGRREDKLCELLIWRPLVDDMQVLARLLADGELAVPIDRTYPLAETGAALDRIGRGDSLGKLVVLPQA